MYFLVTFSLSVLLSFSSIDAQTCPSDANKPWSFDYSLPNGPQHWGETYDDCCACFNKKQSPINIVTANTQKSPDGKGLNLNNYDKPLTKAKYSNNGYFIEVTPTDNVERSLTVNGTTYPLMHFSIRVGNTTKDEFGDLRATPGSDHRVDSDQYDAELQLIHGNGKPQVILSGFFDVSPAANPSIRDIFPSRTLSSVLYKGDTYEASITSKLARLDYILPSGSPYYSYEGSMSFPPCTPGIHWLIKKGRLPIGLSDLISLQRLHSVEQEDPNENQCYIRNNFRQPQPLNDRTVLSVGGRY